MAEIVLSSAVRNNLLSLQNTASLLAKTQQRLSTGLKVNSALDDPTAFFTASSLNSRAGDLNRLLDSIGNAVQTVVAADKGISAITKLVETVQATARQALTAPTGSATATTLTGTNDLSTPALILAETRTFSISVDGGAVVDVDLGAADTVAELDGILLAATTALGNATVSVQGNFIEITAAANTSSITITDGIAAGIADGTTAAPFSSARATLETTFNNLLTQIDQLAADASFNGNNLLNGDNLTVIFNEFNTSSLTITGVTFDAAGLGITAATVDSFQTNAAVNTALANLDTAISALRTQATSFGSNLSVIEIRQDFTKNLINTLETGAANLTLADTNEEGANTLALQTRQQLGSIALSLASQADQQVLRLFQ
jgi:flagellin-like hook-associated protein FlgL